MGPDELRFLKPPVATQWIPPQPSTGVQLQLEPSPRVALTPASSTGPNPRHTGSHLTSSLVGHFPSVDLTSNTAARMSAKAQTETLSSRQNNSLPHKEPSSQNPARGFPLFSLFTHLTLLPEQLSFAPITVQQVSKVDFIQAGLSVLPSKEMRKRCISGGDGSLLTFFF